jgi:hypothetical protein
MRETCPIERLFQAANLPNALLMFGREINPEIIKEALREFLCEYLADPDNEREFLRAIAQAVGLATVDAQEKWLDAHSEILVNAIAERIGRKVRITSQHQLPLP